MSSGTNLDSGAHTFTAVITPAEPGAHTLSATFVQANVTEEVNRADINHSAALGWEQEYLIL